MSLNTTEANGNVIIGNYEVYIVGYLMIVPMDNYDLSNLFLL